MTKRIYVLLSALVLTTTAYGQTLAERGTPLDHLTGDWIMTGAIAGDDVVHEVTAEWVLAGHYLFLHDVARELDEAGNPAYEARIYIGWDEAGERLVCLWLDVTGGGGLTPEGFGYGQPEGDRIPFVWGEGAESGINNTFTYSPEQDSWTWQIDNVRDGQVSNFARVVLTRAAEEPASSRTQTEVDAGILAAIARLSDATAPGGGGADAYGAVLADDFSRWALNSEDIQDREDLIEGIRQWLNEGWRVASRESRLIDASVLDDRAYTTRVVTESYRDPDGVVSAPSTFALEETWRKVEDIWLLHRVTVYPVSE